MFDLLHPSNYLIAKKLLEHSDEHHKTNIYKENPIEKIESEPYSYWIGCTKVFIFEPGELFNFLIWYYENYKESFLMELLYLQKRDIYNYFRHHNDGFRSEFPRIENFDNIYQHDNYINVMEQLIYEQGHGPFITKILMNESRYGSIEIKKLNEHVMYKYCRIDGDYVYR